MNYTTGGSNCLDIACDNVVEMFAEKSNKFSMSYEIYNTQTWA